MLKQEDLNDMDEESDDICVKGLLDYYTQRPEELEDTCLAEFASSYNITQHRPSKCNLIINPNRFYVKIFILSREI